MDVGAENELGSSSREVYSHSVKSTQWISSIVDILSSIFLLLAIEISNPTT